MNNIYWFDHVWDRIETVFVQQLVHRGRFAELHIDNKPPIDEDAGVGPRCDIMNAAGLIFPLEQSPLK